MDTLRIAICDDEQIERELLEKYIHEWHAKAILLQPLPFPAERICSTCIIGTLLT